MPDDLGARLGAALDRVREAGNVRGIVLLLRGNGGGSTDGAADALGVFLPGCPLFPMKRRDGGIETGAGEGSSRPSSSGQGPWASSWTGTRRAPRR